MILKFKNKAAAHMQEQKVRKIFNSISLRYDLANFFISLGIEKYWRFRFLKMVSGNESKILDACCGTGNSTISLAKKLKNDAEIYGIDFSAEMLEIARKKTQRYLSKKTGYPKIEINFLESDAESIDIKNSYFDLITIVFGIRNVPDREKTLKEFHRLTREKGRLLILEFNYPQNRFVKSLYGFYLKYIMCNLGAIISGNRHAYTYLMKSIKNFPDSENFSLLIKDSGWKVLKVMSMTFGICTVYFAQK